MVLAWHVQGLQDNSAPSSLEQAMSLSLHTRAAALVVALSTTASIIVTLAEMGHPPLDGRGAILSLVTPAGAPQLGLALVTPETRRDGAAAFELPQP